MWAPEYELLQALCGIVHGDSAFRLESDEIPREFNSTHSNLPKLQTRRCPVGSMKSQIFKWIKTSVDDAVTQRKQQKLTLPLQHVSKQPRSTVAQGLVSGMTLTATHGTSNAEALSQTPLEAAVTKQVAPFADMALSDREDGASGIPAQHEATLPTADPTSSDEPDVSRQLCNLAAQHAKQEDVVSSAHQSLSVTAGKQAVLAPAPAAVPAEVNLNTIVSCLLLLSPFTIFDQNPENINLM